MNSNFNSTESPVFIVGCGRSGTTLLRLMLNRHSMLAIPEETWFIPRLFAMLPELVEVEGWQHEVVNRIFELNPVHFPNQDKDEIVQFLNGIDKNNFADIVSCLNRAFAIKEGKKMWGDKTSGYVLHIPVLKKFFPSALVIHVIRDGRDVVDSLLNNWEAGPQTTDFSETVQYWKSHVKAGRKDGPIHFGENYIEVKYEELVTKPILQLNRICKFMYVPFEKSMLNYSLDSSRYTLDWSHHENTKEPLNTSSVFKWKNKYDDTKMHLFSLMAGDLLKRLDYDNISHSTLMHGVNSYYTNLDFKFQVLGID